MQMRSLLLLVIYGSCSHFCAQNLVPDSSFESNRAVPTDFSGIGNSNYWTRPSMGTTDLFCKYDRKRKKYSLVDVPNNAMGYQVAHSGSCYAGFFLFSHGDYREYLQTPITPLGKGKTYFLSLYVSLANFSQTYIDQMGFCFLSREEHYRTGDVLEQLTPTYIELDKVKGDTMLWHRVTASYKATGEEKYLVIGSFDIKKVKRTKFRFPKDLKSPINKKSGRDAYYYIDDVSLVEWINPPASADSSAVADTLEPGKSMILKNVLFKSGEAVLENVSYEMLDMLALGLLRDPGLNIEIAGHTDDVGSVASNLDLSERRAAAVADYLVAKGVPKENISTKGYGATKPLLPNDTEANRAVNRRVEIVFQNPGGSK